MTRRRFEYTKLSLDVPDIAHFDMLGGAGWELVATAPAGPHTGKAVWYVFKRELPRDDTEDDWRTRHKHRPTNAPNQLSIGTAMN